MGWKKFTKGAKKTVNSGTKTVDDAAKKTADDAKKVADDAKKVADDAADDAAKAAEDAKRAAEQAAKTTVDSAVSEMNQVIGTSLDWFKSSTTGLSETATKLAADAGKELTRVGDLARAILDEVFLAALEALVDQVFDDFEEFIDETVDILEDISKSAAAATELAAQLAALRKPSDLTSAVKSAFVAYTRGYPQFISHAVLSDVTGFKSVSYGVFGSVAGVGEGLGSDGGLAAESGQISEAYAYERDAAKVQMAVFAGYARSFTTGTGGVSVGVEAASWRDPPSNLAGKCLGVAFTVKALGGASIQFFFADDLSKFLGMNLAVAASPSSGSSLDVFTGETITYVF